MKLENIYKYQLLQNVDQMFKHKQNSVMSESCNIFMEEKKTPSMVSQISAAKANLISPSPLLVSKMKSQHALNTKQQQMKNINKIKQRDSVVLYDSLSEEVNKSRTQAHKRHWTRKDQYDFTYKMTGSVLVICKSDSYLLEILKKLQEKDSSLKKKFECYEKYEEATIQKDTKEQFGYIFNMAILECTNQQETASFINIVRM